MPKYDVKKDYYSILGIGRDSKVSDFKVAYFKLARELHPDKTGGDLKRAERFKLVLEAYTVLTDPDLKEEYDRARLLHGYRNQTRATPSFPSTHERRRTPYSFTPTTPESERYPSAARERARAPYSFTPQPSTSSRPNPMPSSSRTETRSTPVIDKPADKCQFSDYYYPDYEERPEVLPYLRQLSLVATENWRRAENAKRAARHAGPPQDARVSQRRTYIRLWKEAERLRTQKWETKVLYEEHANRARYVYTARIRSHW